jgi:hypothetical protein
MSSQKVLEKLFTEEGSLEGFEGTDALQDEVPTKLTFTSNVTGEGSKFPSGKDGGEGTITRHADGIVNASYEGSLMTDKGQKVTWRSHEKSKVVEGGKKVKGLEIVLGFSQPIIMETEIDLSSKKFTNTAYEWKY